MGGILPKSPTTVGRRGGSAAWRMVLRVDQEVPLSIPWWKGTPNPDAKPESERPGPARPWSEGTPGVQQLPTGFDTSKLRCSAEGTKVFSDRRCACGKRFDGIANAGEGFVESHSVRECIEMTKKAA